MMEEPKLLNYKIRRPILQNGKNRGTKTRIKPKTNFLPECVFN